MPRLPFSTRHRLAGARFRRLALEALETRDCPAFTATWSDTTPPTLTFMGTNPSSISGGSDQLLGIFPFTNGNLWFATNTGYAFGDQMAFATPWDTGRPFPPGGSFKIVIYGLGGDDSVLLGANSFTANSIDQIIFYGGSGNDYFKPPQGQVKVPAPNALPNIRFYGADGQDELDGQNDNEYFEGGGGIDIAKGSGGDDILISGPFLGGAADDAARFEGGPGNDTLTGGPKVDNLYGDDGRDTIDGSFGADRIWGGKGNDQITGGSGNDKISGEEGDDVISAGSGSDLVHGGLNNDSIDTGISGGAPAPISPEDEEFPVADNTYFEVVIGGPGLDSIDASLATGITFLSKSAEELLWKLV